MAHRFTSLDATIEKLYEAEYFLGGLTTSHGCEFGYNLNAFLSACRSVTFVMQKSLSRVTGFAEWYENQQALMKSDPAMGFFVDLRNISQKEGPVRYVGGAFPYSGGWTYCFAGNREAVPTTLIGRDIPAACGDQLAKVARIVDNFRELFPYDSCLHSALSVEGISFLKYSLDDVGALLGLPTGYLNVGSDISFDHKLRVVRRQLDPIDREGLERLAKGKFQRGDEELSFVRARDSDLTDDIGYHIEKDDAARRMPRVAFLTALAHRMDKIVPD